MKTELKYKISQITLLLTTATGILSCDQENAPSFVDLPVVEAYLLAESEFELKISRQIPSSENARFSDDDINVLPITVSSDGTDYFLTPAGNGRYTDNTLVLTAGKQYDLRFMYDGKEVAASTVIPSKPSNFRQSATEMVVIPQSGMNMPSNQPDPVKFTWDNPDASWHILVVENTETTLKPIFDSNTGVTTFRNTPTRGDNYELTARAFQYYGNHRIILFHITPDYAILYDDNETTSQNLATPSTGMMNGVGIFTGIHADTLWLDINEH